MSRGKSLLLGLFVGGIVSAGVTLLNAPKSGKETRADIKGHADEAKASIDHVRMHGKELSEQIINTSKEGAKLIKELSLDVKDSIESWKTTIEPHQEKIKVHLLEIEERLKELEDQTTPASE